MARKKVAVAGGLGFLGSNVTRVLGEHGYEVIPFSRRTGVDIRVAGQLESFLETQQPDVVINCAAHVGGIAYNAQVPVEIYEDNLTIGFNVVRACARVAVKKLVNVMPNCTYPGVADVYREDEWWNGEMHETVLTYGMPRKAMWAHCWAYHQKGLLNSIHVVLPNLYGPHDHFDPLRSHALGALIRKIVDAKRAGLSHVEIWGTGEPIREWGYVEDAAEGIVRAMELYDELAIINVGQGEGCTIRALGDMIREAAQWDGEFIFDPTRPDGAPKKILGVERMERHLHWAPPTSLHDGIKKTVRWYLENTK